MVIDSILSYHSNSGTWISFCGGAASRAESLRLSVATWKGRGWASGGAVAKRIADLTESRRHSAREAAQPHNNHKVSFSYLLVEQAGKHCGLLHCDHIDSMVNTEFQEEETLCDQDCKQHSSWLFWQCSYQFFHRRWQTHPSRNQQTGQ